MDFGLQNVSGSPLRDRIEAQLVESMNARSLIAFEDAFKLVLEFDEQALFNIAMCRVIHRAAPDAMQVAFSEQCLAKMLLMCPKLAQKVGWVQVAEVICKHIDDGFIYSVHLIPGLSNIVDVNKIRRADGAGMLHAMVGDTSVSNELLFKAITMGDLDVHLLSDKYGKPLHAIDLERDNLLELVQFLMDLGADPLEEVKFRRRMDGFDAPREYTSFEDFVEQNKNNHGVNFRNVDYVKLCDMMDRMRLSRDALGAVDNYVGGFRHPGNL